MPTNDGSSGVSNCYVFKSRLQEYAQKVGLPTPVYETSKEGPSHEPSFRSTVIVNDVRYESLPGFFNRKAAEQSAAEVALMELAKRGEVNECISQPVHETGLCKNLLQEYAQKMNYAIPMYQCRKDEAPGRVPRFSCTVEIGGIQYIGAAARTKKEAEIKAARTALLAIQSSASELSGKPVGNSQLTVIPCRKRGAELSHKPEAEETVNAPKAKKARFKKKGLKNRLFGDKTGHTQVQGSDTLSVHLPANWEGSRIGQTNASSIKVVDSGPLSTEATGNCQEGGLNTEPIRREISAMQGPFSQNTAGDSLSGNPMTANSNQGGLEAPNVVTSFMSHGEVTASGKEVNELSVHSTAANSNQSGREDANVITSFTFHGDVTAHTTATNSDQIDRPLPNTITSSMSSGGTDVPGKEVNEATKSGEVSPMVNNPILGQMDSSFVIPGVNQQEEMMQTGISRA